MAPLVLYLTPTYRAVIRCWESVREDILKPIIGQISTLLNPSNLPDVNVDSIDRRTGLRCRGFGVRVSAPMRRGAAPYADASWL